MNIGVLHVHARRANLSRDLDHAIWSWLPSNNGHLFLYCFDIWGVVRLSSVRESHNSLSILAFLLRPVLYASKWYCQGLTGRRAHRSDTRQVAESVRHLLLLYSLSTSGRTPTVDFQN